MNRRTALKLLGKTALLAMPFGSRESRSAFLDEAPSLVLLYDSSSSDTSLIKSLLEEVDPYLSLREPDWRNALVRWDVRFDGRKIRPFVERYGPNTTFPSWPILISVPDSTSDSVETWTVPWLKERILRPQPDCYPISGSWWSVDGDWNPSIGKVRDHLYKSPNHTGGKFELPWLTLLKLAELQSLHSDHHREMIGQGKVHWQVVNNCPMLGMD